MNHESGYGRAHRQAEHIFRNLLPAHGMAVREGQIALCHAMPPRHRLAGKKQVRPGSASAKRWPIWWPVCSGSSSVPRHWSSWS